MRGRLRILRKAFTLNLVITDLFVDDSEGKSESNKPKSAKKYSAASPDEEALVLAAASYGIELHSRDNNLVYINVRGELRTYEVLQVLEFNSYRYKPINILRQRQKSAQNRQILFRFEILCGDFW